MSPIEQHGFLGESMKEWINEIRSKYSDFFELAIDMNEMCQKVMFDLDVHNRNSQEIIIASLYIRCLSTFQGLVLLAERGMMAQARILARSLMEALFTLCALSKKSQLFDVFIKEDKRNRLTYLRKYREFHGGKLPENVSQEEIEELEKELETEIKENGIQKRRTEQWADDAGMKSWYLTAYPVLSDSVHTKVRDLEEHLWIDEKGEVSELLWGPDNRGIDKIIMTGIEAMHYALGSTLIFFRLQRDGEMKELRSRFEKLISRISPL